LSFTTTGPPAVQAVSHLFSDYYSKDATETMLTTDIVLLAELAERSTEYITVKLPAASESTWADLKSELASSLASNKRLQRELINDHKMTVWRRIEENFADLLKVLGFQRDE